MQNFACSVFALGFATLFATSSTHAAGRSWCDAYRGQLERVRKEIDALDCADIYFAHPEYDVPNGQFDNVVAYLTRAMQLNPNNDETQTTAIWLRYSRWVAAQNEPARFPQYAGELALVYRMADEFESHFASKAGAIKALADQLLPIWQYHDRTQMPRLLRLYRVAEARFGEPAGKTRCRLNVGHIYRTAGDRPAAIAAYRWVLEIDPDNEVALRYLAALED